MKTSIYGRESTADTTRSPDIKGQLETYHQWCNENKHTAIKEYLDNGYSGGDWNRPAWNQLMKEARAHWFETVWVWSQDRIARDTEQFLKFYRSMRDSNVKVFSHTEGWIDMDTLGGRVQHTTLAMAAEIFRLTTSDKVKKKYEQKSKEALQKGVKVNWGRKPVTLDLNKVLALREQGFGYRAIAKEFPNVSYQTIRRLLQNTPSNLDIQKSSKNGEVIKNPIE